MNNKIDLLKLKMIQQIIANKKQIIANKKFIIANKKQIIANKKQIIANKNLNKKIPSIL